MLDIVYQKRKKRVKSKIDQPIKKRRKKNINNKIKKKTKKSFIVYFSFHLPRISESRKRQYSLESISILLPPYSGKSTLSPGLTLTGMISPLWARPPGPTATTVALSTFPTALSGSTIPPLVVVSLAKRSTKTRSNNGISLLIAPDFKSFNRTLHHCLYYQQYKRLIYHCFFEYILIPSDSI